MIHKQKIRIPSSEKIVELFVSPCVKCDSDDIKIEEYEDQYGYISTATCKKCKNTIKSNTSESGIIKEWNNQNDVFTLIGIKSDLIYSTQEELKILKKKLKLRQK